MKNKIGMLVYYYQHIWQVPAWARHLPLVVVVLLLLLGFSAAWELKNIFLRKLDGLSISVAIQNPQPTPVLTSAHEIKQEVEEVKTSKPKAWVSNEAAPVDKEYLSSLSETTKKYIQDLAPIAVGEMEKFGVPASISLAQGLVESRAGTSKLAKKANNHFGIKCFSRKCKAGHCMNATDDTHKDFFKIFQSRWYSWREHTLLLSRGRYAKLKKHGRDYRKWAYGLKSAGYATDKHYAQALINIIEKYDLHKYDRMSSANFKKP